VPSVEYAPKTLAWDTETREYTDPETGETVTIAHQIEQS
jgi:hypothetical protein